MIPSKSAWQFMIFQLKTLHSNSECWCLRFLMIFGETACFVQQTLIKDPNLKHIFKIVNQRFQLANQCLQIWVFPRNVVPKPPNHPFVHRFFHEINHHPFWGVKSTPYFWFNTHISRCCNLEGHRGDLPKLVGGCPSGSVRIPGVDDVRPPVYGILVNIQ